MKVNQIVGEHKKGFRAKKYNAKPKSLIDPIKPQAPKSAEDQRKDIKEEDTTIKQYEPGRTVTVDDPTTGVSTTVDLTKSPGALRPNDKGELELDATPSSGGPMGATTTQPQAPKIAPGTKVKMAPGDGTVQEEPNEDMLATSSDHTNTFPVATNRSGMKVALVKGNNPDSDGYVIKQASGEITNDLVNRSQDGFRLVYLKTSTGKIPGLLNDSRKTISVGPNDYAAMSYRPPRGSLGGVGPNGTMYKESADDILLDKMLTIAGLR